MREILFRGKCGYNNEWVEGFYYQAKLYRSDKELCHYITIPHPESDGQPSDHIMVRPETVGQFTGLTDKIGKKIFEGDVVEVLQDKDKGVAYVGFENGSFMLYPIAGNIYERTLWAYWYNDWDVDVIGNIHDNPELLENH